MVETTATGWGPQAGVPPHPSLYGPIEFRKQVICGVEYHEPVDDHALSSSCICGIFAIGSCQLCSKPKCGRHGSIFEGSFTCAVDIAEVKAERKRLGAERLVHYRAQFDRGMKSSILADIGKLPTAVQRCARAQQYRYWWSINEAPPQATKRDFYAKIALDETVAATRDLVLSGPWSECVDVRSADPKAWRVSREGILRWLKSRRDPDNFIKFGWRAKNRRPCWYLGTFTTTESHYVTLNMEEEWTYQHSQLVTPDGGYFVVTYRRGGMDAVLDYDTWKGARLVGWVEDHQSQILPIISSNSTGF